MNWLSFILALIPHVVKGVQTLVGDSASGATKAQMAHDALATATNAASQVLTGQNAIYGQAASQIAQVAIDQTVDIAKATGAYQKWTEAAKAATTDLGLAGAAVNLVQQTQAAPTPTPTPTV